MKLLSFEIVKDRGSVKAIFGWEHEGFEFFQWRIVRTDFAPERVISPQIKVASDNGTLYRRTVRIPQSLMREVSKAALGRYFSELKSNEDNGR